MEGVAVTSRSSPVLLTNDPIVLAIRAVASCAGTRRRAIGPFGLTNESIVKPIEAFALTIVSIVKPTEAFALTIASIVKPIEALA